MFEPGEYQHREEFTASTLRRVDPATLLPVGKELRLGDSVTSRAASPDGSTLAFGGLNYGKLIYVDPSTMRRRSVRVTKERLRTVIAYSWPRRDVLVAGSCLNGGKWGCFENRLWIVDPTGRRPRRSLRLPAAPHVSYHPGTGRTFVLVSSFRGGIRPARMLVVEPDGRIRRLVLQAIVGGRDARRPFGAHYVGPSLALDRREGLAVIVGPDVPVAAVDVRTLRVRYHVVPGLDVPEAAIARDRPREWTGTHNPHSESARDAYAVRPGLLRVVMRETRLGPGYRVREQTRSVGLDLARWRLRPLRSAEPAGPVWLANTRPADRREYPPFRLVAYDERGHVVYRIDGRRRRLYTWRSGAGLLYAGRMDGAMTHVFELATGKLIRKIPPRYISWETAVFRWAP